MVVQSDWNLAVNVVLTDTSCGRRSTSTSAKEPIQSAQTCAMLQPMFYGLWPEPKTYQLWHHMRIILLVDLSLSLCMTARFIYVEQQVPLFKNMSGEWYVVAGYTAFDI